MTILARPTNICGRVLYFLNDVAHLPIFYKILQTNVKMPIDIFISI